MKRVALLLFLMLFGGAAYYYVFDGSLPSESNYDLNIAEIRSLADAPAEQLPTAIRTEILARPAVPKFALRAGAGFGEAVMLRTAFQIVTPDGHYVLEAGMDQLLAEEHGQSEGFDQAVWERIQQLMSGAKGVMVTHEHPDHMGGIVRHSEAGALADKLLLTSEQYQGLSRYTVRGNLPPGFDAYKPLAIESMHKVAPGIVMIKAAGHTPGSVIFFVKLASGTEYLFIGDIAYTESNVVDGVDRTRFVRLLMVDPEDREAVVHQLKAIHQLSKAEPELNIVPAHAEKTIMGLIGGGKLTEGFDLSRPAEEPVTEPVTAAAS